MPKPAIELVSFTYKVNGKLFTKNVTAAAAPAKKKASPLKKAAGKNLGLAAVRSLAPAAPMAPAAPHPDAADNGCGDGARCVNGLLEILICFGSTCQWERTNTPCNC